jgi:hypothetical protein
MEGYENQPRQDKYDRRKRKSNLFFLEFRYQSHLVAPSPGWGGTQAEKASPNPVPSAVQPRSKPNTRPMHKKSGSLQKIR